MFLVIQYETSYEKHLKEYNNIYQVVTKDKDAEGEHFTVGIPFPVIKYLRADNPNTSLPRTDAALWGTGNR